MSKKIKYLVAPNPLDKNLTKEINGFDESFKKTKTKVIIEVGVYSNCRTPKGPPEANMKYTISPTTTGGIPINELMTIRIKLLNKNFFRAI